MNQGVCLVLERVLHQPRIGKILLATRDPRFVSILSPVSDNLRVKVMGIADAWSFPSRYLPPNIVQDAEDEHTKELLWQFRYVSLGIAQVAVNVCDLAICLGKFLEKSYHMELLVELFMDTQATSRPMQSCLITWESSFQSLEEWYRKP